MENLSDILSNKIYRIPDYQRGYAWENEQLNDFWNDLCWIQKDDLHYTGSLTIIKKDLSKSDERFPKMAGNVYDLVDGQQRIVSSVILISTLYNLSSIEEIGGKNTDLILNQYLRTKISDEYLYLVGYDNFEMMEFFQNLLNLNNKKSLNAQKKNIYHHRLYNAKKFFAKRLKKLKKTDIDEIFFKLTTKFVFDKREVDDDFEVCALFESINYRGKPLTKFEVLKNRLIYLVEIIKQRNGCNESECENARDTVNSSWSEAYKNFGFGNTVLDEDDFLKSHSIMYFGSLPKTKNALDALLFKNTFSPEKLDNDGEMISKICLYANNISLTSKLWSFMHGNKEITDDFDEDVQLWLTRIYRIGFFYFKPIILAALHHCKKNELTEEIIIELKDMLAAIERFIFLIFYFCDRKSTFLSSMVSYANSIFIEEAGYTLEEIAEEINGNIDGYDEDDEGDEVYIGYFDSDQAANNAFARFKSKKGYYEWKGSKYLLSEYESFLSNKNISQKEYEKLTIEHIMPMQFDDDSDWKKIKDDLRKRFKYVLNDIGNLTLLTKNANSTLGNTKFIEKVPAYKNGNKDNKKIVDISGKKYEWNEVKILIRGREIIEFLFSHWDIDENELAEVLPDEFLSKVVTHRKKKRK